MRGILVGLCFATFACGGPPAPEGPGTEPTDTSGQTSKAGPKPNQGTARTPTTTDRPPTPPDGEGDGKRMPPTYDLKLVPKCQGSPRGAKTRAPLKSFVGIKEADLIGAYGPPSCIYRGQWRYEFRKEPCPEYVDTISIKLRGGVVVDQKSYRKPTGVSCE